MRNLRGKPGGDPRLGLFSLEPMISFPFPWSVGNRMPHSRYLNGERHSCRRENAHSLALGSQHWVGEQRSQEMGMEWKLTWKKHTLLPAGRAFQPSPHVGERESWRPCHSQRLSYYTRLGKSKIGAENGLSKGLVPTPIVSVGTNNVCSVETEPLHKLCFLLPTSPVSLFLYFTEQ